MRNESYYWDNVSEQLLKKLEFRYSQGFSSEDCKAFIKTIPLYRYSEVILLDLRIVAWLDGEVRIDVMDSCFHSYYAAWYLGETEDRYPILKEVEKRLKKILTLYGIKEITNEDGSEDKEVN